jgi:hypothetical protein
VSASAGDGAEAAETEQEHLLDSGASVLARLQRGLETLYRVETRLDVDAFMVDEEARNQALGDEGRRPREQLLVSQSGEELALALFLDEGALANLARHDPASGLSEHNFWDFCLAVEGVSHFIYVALCAARDRPVTALELELQAEVDKFVSCTLVQGEHDTTSLRERLFERIRLHHDLDEEERHRYRLANDQARRYSISLDRRYLSRGRVDDMLAELRRFYRLGLREKLQHIAQAA